MRISTGAGRASYTGFDAGEGFCDTGDGPLLPTPSQSVRPIFVPTANSSTRVCALVFTAGPERSHGAAKSSWVHGRGWPKTFERKIR